LPLKFVEQILLQLRGAGYIETRRGKFGGYRSPSHSTKSRWAKLCGSLTAARADRLRE
jgi:hypothetical protein